MCRCIGGTHALLHAFSYDDIMPFSSDDEGYLGGARRDHGMHLPDIVLVAYDVQRGHRDGSRQEV